VVNNRKSRIELYYQRADAKPGDEKPTTPGSNELPELWRFRRETISVPHEVLAVLANDFDHDGKMDLIYAGQPGTIAFVQQKKPGVFEIIRKTPVKNLVGKPRQFAACQCEWRFQTRTDHQHWRKNFRVAFGQ